VTNHPTADALVIGAGAWGLASAWQLARDGASVVLLDDGGPPASAVAAGMLAPWSELEDDGEHHLHDARRAAASRWPAFAATLAEASGLPSGYARCGALHVAARPAHAGLLRRLERTVAAAGDAANWLRRDALLALEPGLGAAVRGGLELPDEHQADPLLTLLALRCACARAGVRALAGAAVALRPDGAALADGGRVRAGSTIVAAGARASALSGAVPLRPIKGEVVTLAPRPRSAPPPTRIIRTPDVYLVPRPDGRVVVGATVEESLDPLPGADGVHALLDEAFHTCPDLRGMAFEGVAVGFRPATADGMPALGRDADGVVWAAGGYRHGILLLPLVGEAVGAAVSGTPTADVVAAFTPSRLREVACA